MKMNYGNKKMYKTYDFELDFICEDIISRDYSDPN